MVIVSAGIIPNVDNLMPDILGKVVVNVYVLLPSARQPSLPFKIRFFDHHGEDFCDGKRSPVSHMAYFCTVQSRWARRAAKSAAVPFTYSAGRLPG